MNIINYLLKYFTFSCYSLLDRIGRNTKATDRPIHLIFLFVDHFEPGNNPGRVEEWINLYSNQVSNNIDSDGNMPLHTWFYPCEQLDFSNLMTLSRAAYDGLGEIELHLHHSNDSDETLCAKLSAAIQQYSSIGALIHDSCESPQYAFIHGNWSLANSRAKGSVNYCGVDNEIKILKETGCYSDFTFPSNELLSQPRRINSIYYSDSRYSSKKSYTWGNLHSRNHQSSDELLIMQGPLTFNWSDRKYGIIPRIEDADVASYYPPTISRAKLWIKTNIHRVERPDWVFVKVHTHGAHRVHMPIVLGDDMQQIYSYLEKNYKSSGNSLHYVTAREAYNIIKAAEDGMDGNPEQYRDYLIGKPLNRILNSSIRYNVKNVSNKIIEISMNDELAVVKIKAYNEIKLVGRISKLKIDIGKLYPEIESVWSYSNEIVINNNSVNIVQCQKYAVSNCKPMHLIIDG